jgi:hypothetical protein
MKVDSIATKKRMIRSRGLIFSKLVKTATITVEIYTNQIPGKLRMVNIRPVRANIPATI